MILTPGKYYFDINTPEGETTKEKYKHIIAFSHYDAKSNSGIDCSAGLAWTLRNGTWMIEPGEQPCVGCELKRQGSKSIGTSFKNTMTVVVPGNWHLVTEKDQNGRDTERWVHCDGRRNCRLCDRGLVRQIGRQGRWSLGPSHYESLLDQQDRILAKRCINCGGTISITRFICPECGTRFAKANQLSKEEARELRIKGSKCRDSNCSYKGPFFPVPRCSGCDDPQPTAIWNTPIIVSKTGTGVSSSYRIDLPDEEIPESQLSILQALMIPYEVSEIVRITDLKQQAERLKSPNPYEKEHDGAMSRAWEEDEDEPPSNKKHRSFDDD